MCLLDKELWHQKNAHSSWQRILNKVSLAYCTASRTNMFVGLESFMKWDILDMLWLIPASLVFACCNLQAVAGCKQTSFMQTSLLVWHVYMWLWCQLLSSLVKETLGASRVHEQICSAWRCNWWFCLCNKESVLWESAHQPVRLRSSTNSYLYILSICAWCSCILHWICFSMLWVIIATALKTNQQSHPFAKIPIGNQVAVSM